MQRTTSLIDCSFKEKTFTSHSSMNWRKNSKTEGCGYHTSGDTHTLQLTSARQHASKIFLKFPKSTTFEIASTWSIFRGSPSKRRASAGIISPSFTLMISPGTKITASFSPHWPSRRTWKEDVSQEELRNWFKSFLDFTELRTVNNNCNSKCWEPKSWTITHFTFYCHQALTFSVINNYHIRKDLEPQAEVTPGNFSNPLILNASVLVTRCNVGLATAHW